MNNDFDIITFICYLTDPNFNNHVREVNRITATTIEGAIQNSQHLHKQGLDFYIFDTIEVKLYKIEMKLTSSRVIPIDLS